jgi:hypothetical protein
VDRAVDGFEELPEDGGGGVAQHSALAAGEDGSHEATREAQASVPYGVDAVVDAVELTAIDAISNRPCTQASAFKLPPRRDTVLPRGDRRRQRIGHVAFLTHVGT